MNPMDNTSDIENLLRGVHERIKEHSQREKKNQQQKQPAYETPNPATTETGNETPTLILAMSSDGVWRVD